MGHPETTIQATTKTQKQTTQIIAADLNSNQN